MINEMTKLGQHMLVHCTGHVKVSFGQDKYCKKIGQVKKWNLSSHVFGIKYQRQRPKHV